MFGMLDCRAYKLLWLICLPLRFVIWLAAWASVFVAILISASMGYSAPIGMIIAYAIWEGIAIVLLIIRAIVFWLTKNAFFWVIDVIPAKGADLAEAKEMVVGGPLLWLGKKFTTDIQNWTAEDTEQLASAIGGYRWLVVHCPGCGTV
jgi:uncharacterized membrane protein (Fun14 family)